MKDACIYYIKITMLLKKQKKLQTVDKADGGQILKHLQTVLTKLYGKYYIIYRVSKSF